MLRSSWIALIGALIFITCPAWAQSLFRDDNTRIVINATNMKRLSQENTIVLKGNVQLAFGESSLTCDEALIRQSKQEIEAKGNIYLATTSAVVSGDRMILNYKDKTGIIYNGIVKMDQVIFQGEVINKLGDKEYEVISAEYTSCTTCPPAWAFSGSKINAEMGGYARIRNPVMKVAKIPLLWLPYLMVPLNSKRQTGFLFPEFAYSEKVGLSYSQPFFWAISPNTDATFTSKILPRRGVKGLTNYRYVLTEQSRGEADFGYIRDKLLTQDQFFKGSDLENKETNRWHIKYKHTYVMPFDYIHRANLNLASDLRYARDFSKEFPGWGDSSLENRMSLTKNTERNHASIDSSIYFNQLKAGPLDSNDDAVHRFPEVRYSLAPRRLFESPILFQADVRYNNFTRESYSFDDRQIVGSNFEPETNASRIGVYNSESDLIRTGQRFDIAPKISLPIALGPYFDLNPSLTYRETDYQFPLQEKQSAQRRLLRSDVSLRTRFSRIFGDLENPYATRYRHEIVPEVTHTQIPWVSRQRHPFFGDGDEESYFTANTALSDADTLKQFDYHDRLYEKNLFTFAISNYLIRKKMEGEEAKYSRLALFRLSQSFDYFEYVKTTHPTQPYSDISALLDVRLDFFETNTLVRYFPYQNVARAESRVKFLHPNRHYLELNYSQDFQIVKGQSVNAAARTEDLITSAGIYFPNIWITGKTTYTFVKKEFLNYGYVLTVQPPGNCWQIMFSQERLPDDFVTKFSASFLFDGKNATSLPEGS